MVERAGTTASGLPIALTPTRSLNEVHWVASLDQVALTGFVPLKKSEDPWKAE